MCRCRRNRCRRGGCPVVRVPAIDLNLRTLVGAFRLGPGLARADRRILGERELNHLSLLSEAGWQRPWLPGMFGFWPTRCPDDPHRAFGRAAHRIGGQRADLHGAGVVDHAVQRRLNGTPGKPLGQPRRAMVANAQRRGPARPAPVVSSAQGPPELPAADAGARMPTRTPDGFAPGRTVRHLSGSIFSTAMPPPISGL